jgi:hypothetical protein
MSLGRVHEGSARALLDAGARTTLVRVERFNYADDHGTCRTLGCDALKLAAQASFSSEFVTALQDRGACLGHLGATQYSALMMAIHKTRARAPAVAAAAEATAASIVERVRERGAAFDALPLAPGMPPARASDALDVPDCKSCRALHHAASFGCASLVSAPMSAGADREAHCRAGWTPLMAAAGSCQAGAVEALLTGGAFVNNHDGFGVTALHAAIVHSPRSGDLDCLDVLLACPADTDLHATTITGLTLLALALAGLVGNLFVIGRLEERIAADEARGTCSWTAAEREAGRLAALSVTQLRTELAVRGNSDVGMRERGELVEALLAPRSARSAPRKS